MVNTFKVMGMDMSLLEEKKIAFRPETSMKKQFEHSGTVLFKGLRVQQIFISTGHFSCMTSTTPPFSDKLYC